MGQPYREPGPVPPDPCLAAWSRLRARRLGIRAAAFAYLGLVVPSIALWLTPVGVRALGVALALTIAMPAGLLILSLLTRFACPGCDQAFFASATEELGRARKCCSCGLAIGSPMSTCSPVRRASLVSYAKNRACVPPSRFWRLVDRVPDALHWLVYTVAASLAGYVLVHVLPAPTLALGVAVGVTTLIAQIVESRAFPRSLLFPTTALLLASLMAMHSERPHRRRGAVAMHDPRCANVNARSGAN